MALGPVPDATGRRHVLRGAHLRCRDRASGTTRTAPTGVNSVEYDGRPACNNCGFCGYFGCPIEAKGDPVAPFRTALRTGRCEIRPESYVTEVLLDGTGRTATGVRYLDAEGEAHEVSAKHVILGAGAFETPRLLLRSQIGNPDVVGRYLMYHFQTFALGVFPFRLHAHRGRAVTHLMDDPIVPDELAMAASRDADLPWMRGGIVEHGGGSHPVMESIHLPFGERHTRYMLESTMRDRMAAFTMQGEDLPQATNRVDLDPQVTDAWGSPPGASPTQPIATRSRARTTGPRAWRRSCAMPAQRRPSGLRRRHCPSMRRSVGCTTRTPTRARSPGT